MLEEKVALQPDKDDLHIGYAKAGVISGVRRLGEGDMDGEKKEKVVNDKHEDDKEALRCGYGACRPNWLQICNSPKAYIVFFCFFVLIQSFLVSGINNVNTTSLERRFDLPSSKVGLISGSYDFSAGATVILVGYFGGQGHKPRWIATACLLVGVGGLIMSLPHFTTSMYSVGAETHMHCESNSTSPVCVSDTSLQNYLGVFILGMVVIGLGGTTLYSVGTSFLDESVKVENAPLYIAIMYAVSTLGPGLGYVLGGFFLQIYVDFDQADSKASLSSEDPGWVGAWWIGYGFGGILALLISIVLFSYPRHLPSAESAKKSREISQAYDNGAEQFTSNPNFGKSIKDMPRALKIILTNPTFMCITLGGTIDALALSGFSTFMPKFIQNQFNQSASWAAYLSGFVIIPAACGGQILGGFLLKKLKLSIRKSIIVIIIGSCASCVCCAIFWLYCPAPNVAGVQVAYPNSSSIRDLESTCNLACHCTTENYDAVCAHDSVSNTLTQYFSACHAGCTNKDLTNCGCVSFANGNTTTVTKGACADDCMLMPVFLAFLFFLIFFTFLTLPPGASVTLRCVPDSQRAFALGVQWVFIRFLGSFPGPILFGAIIDSSCLVWKENCSERGSCWIYDNQQMSRNIFLLGMAVKIPVCILFYLARYLYKAPPKAAQSVTLSTMNDDSSTDVVTTGEDGGGDAVGFRT